MSDNDLIRRGDAIAACQDIISAVEMESIPAAPAPAVKVKPLVWVSRPDIPGLTNAQSHVGWWYNINENRDGSFTYEGDPMATPMHSLGSRYDTIEAAKAAAQADYEARILSAIKVTAPAPTLAAALALPEIAALVDARLRHINAVKEYNTKLDQVKDARKSGDWTGNVERECASMNEAYSRLIDKMQVFCDAALAAIEVTP